MTVRPIIFSGPMVRALLDGRKTMTRRLASSPLAKAQAGDLLWVRESWWHDKDGGDVANEYGYLADGYYPGHGSNCGHVRHRPSIHMPRWASRLTLEVTGVKVERLQDISEEDAIAEGIRPWKLGWHSQEDHEHIGWKSPAIAFRDLWNRLHGPDAWDANPWVVAISFTVHKANVDALIERRAA
ncbi:MAG TPA: hypothetical protein VIK75_10195 [Calditerricola sp.]